MMLDTVICIGAGFSQIPYIKEVKKRGYRVICADRNPNSLGFELVDDYVVSSTFDYIKTPQLIFKRIKDKDRIKSVIGPCTGPPFRTVQELRKLFDLPCYDYKTLNILLDKLYFRKYCNSIGCSNISVFNDKKILNSNCFPLVKKLRAGGMGGKEVELYNSLDDFRTINRSTEIEQKYVYEKLICGREIAVDAIWDGNSIVFLNTGWQLFDIQLDIIIGSTCQEDNDLRNLNYYVKEILHKFCRSLNLNPEVLNVDMILDSNDLLHIIEIDFVPAARIPLCKLAFRYDLVRNYVSTYLGDNIQSLSMRKVNTALVSNINYDRKSENVDYTDIDSVKTSSISNFYLIKNPYRIQTKKGSAIVDGFYIISNNDSNELIKDIRNMFPNISLRRADHD